MILAQRARQLSWPLRQTDTCPLLHSPNREQLNTANTEIHLIVKLSTEILRKCLIFFEAHPISRSSPFASCLEGKGILFFLQDQMDTAKK